MGSFSYAISYHIVRTHARIPRFDNLSNLGRIAADSNRRAERAHIATSSESRKNFGPYRILRTTGQAAWRSYR